MTSKQYEKEQLKLRLMQMFYGQGFFTLPHFYKLKNKAYKKAFNSGQDFRMGSHCWIYRTHGSKEGIISIGYHVKLADDVTIDYSGEVEIGSYVSIAEGVNKHNRVGIMKKNW